MSCSSLTSCQHGHVRTLSSTDEHVFARLGWIHDPVCSVALPTAVIPFTFRACPRSAVCCRIKPYHFCIQPGPRPRSPPSDDPALQLSSNGSMPASPAEPAARGPRRRGARAGAPCATRCGCPRAPGVGRTLGRGGVARKALAGARRGVAAGLGPATVASAETATRTVEFETADSSVPARRRPRLHARRDRAVMRQGPSKASYLNHGNRQSPAAAFPALGPRCCTCCCSAT